MTMLIEYFPQHYGCSQLCSPQYNNLYCIYLVEDPSPEFTALRDYIDCHNVLKLPSFQPSCLLQSYSPEMEREFQEKLKLHKVFTSNRVANIDVFSLCHSAFSFRTNVAKFMKFYD